MSAAAANDPELQRVLDAIASRYNSDKSFKEQLAHVAKTQSQNFVEKLVQEILGFVTGTLLKAVMGFISRAFG